MIIRKTPIREKLRSLPLDLWLSLCESWNTLELPECAGAVIGAVCWMMLLWSREQPTLTGVFADERPSRLAKPVFLFLSLLSISVLWRVANAHRTYFLRGRPIDQPLKSPRACQLRDPQDGQLIWTLQIWDPSAFHLYLLAVFSPLHIFIGWFAPRASVLVSWAFSLLLVLAVRQFVQHEYDRRIIEHEVFNEYAIKVVRPITSLATRDVAVDTDHVREYASLPRREFVQRDVRAPFRAVRLPARRTYMPGTPGTPDPYNSQVRRSRHFNVGNDLKTPTRNLSIDNDRTKDTPF